MNKLRFCLIFEIVLLFWSLEGDVVHGMVRFSERSAQKEFAQDRVIVCPEQTISIDQLEELASNMGAKVLKIYSHTNSCIVSLPEGMEVKECVCLFKEQTIIRDAEPDYIVHADIVPNDSNFNQLYGLHNTGQTGGALDADIDAVEAWDTRTDCGSVVVAVIDSGVDYTHEDLAANMWRNPGEIAGDLIDNDGNGYIDDVFGIDAHNNDSDPLDDDGHGTHLSGTIGAVGNNTTGITGVCWNVQIMALKFLDASGSGFTSNVLECIDYMVNMKSQYGINVKVSNNSWSGNHFSAALESAIAVARDADILFVAAAGNEQTDNDITPSYPNSYTAENIISVAASNANDNLSGFSNYGATTVDLTAPGSSIYSTIPNNSYTFLSGTSMATPYVSGVAALLAAENPTFSYGQIKGLLLDSVDVVPALTGLVATGGRLNVGNSLHCDESRFSLEIYPPDTVLLPGNTQQFTAAGLLCNTSSDITSLVIWASSDALVATVDTTGLVTSVGVGTAQITASHNGIISPAVSLRVLLPDGDEDNDGLTNSEELLNGTDPLVARKPELVVDFVPPYGINIMYNNTGFPNWTGLHYLNAGTGGMVVGDLDGNDKADLIVDFGPSYGINIMYNNAGFPNWTGLHHLSSGTGGMVVGDLDGNDKSDLVVDLGPPYGINVFYNNMGAWTSLHHLSANAGGMVVGDLDGNDKSDLVVDFGPPYGINVFYNNTGPWTNLHHLSAGTGGMKTGDLDGSGQDDLIVDFVPPYGINVFYNNTGPWTSLHHLSAGTGGMVAGDLDGSGQDDLIVDFVPPYGINVFYNNTGPWVGLHHLSAGTGGLVAGDLDENGQDDLVVDFGLYGINIFYNNSVPWVGAHHFSAGTGGMVISDLDGN
ncbi:MAG: hypothetical protein D8M57_17085 [Candidatus Scalindua sp. AMX11]|nr:MAG: hypothetical protein DWQ00_12530 [Candidatus Scalindua sp.]NOG84066.1 S8 family serine peptidase [Planctomycetota bacterium]TDE63685.1 MAG: hypothetical protein D8M57_17085 [Candidatus Scalindua sp. AMX11]GJQ60556.1 MAG: hypothetical protein SCALA701_33570 [Candidatus Scalindua sp.]